MPSKGREFNNELARVTRIVPHDEKPCVWMTAGVLTYWICDRDFCCEQCPLDGALRHVPGRVRCVEETKAPRKLQSRSPAGPARTPKKKQSADAGPSLEEALELRLPHFDRGALYSRAHTWARFENPECARIGLDPFAASVVGRSRNLVLTSIGAKVLQGHPCAWLDQDGGTLTILSPLTGSIIARNERLVAASNLQLRDSQGEDWLLCIKPSHPQSESKQLFGAKEFGGIVKQDRARWQSEMLAALEDSAPTLGVTLQDGGQPLHDFKDILGSKRQHHIVAPFLTLSGR